MPCDHGCRNASAMSNTAETRRTLGPFHHLSSDGRRKDLENALMKSRILVVQLSAIALLCSNLADAQPPRGQGQRPPVVISPEVKADRQVVFRIHAPKAQSVALF